MAPRKKSSSKQPNVGAWLGGNKGYVLSGSNTDTSAKADAGGGQAEAVRGELGLGAYTAGIGATAAIGAGVAAARASNPIRVAARRARANSGDFVVGETTAEQLMKLRSADRFEFDSRVRTPPRIKDDAAHLANIRKQNVSSYEYENRTRLYSDEDLSGFSNLSEDIRARGIQSPVTVGRIKGKPTLLEGNHRVIAQFDIDPKAKVPFEVSQRTWDVTNKETKGVARRANVRAATEKVKKIVPKRK